MENLETIKNKTHSELTEEDWNLLRDIGIVNGFGPRQSPIIRFFLSLISSKFKIASADIHDFNYWKGGTEEDRRMADEGFFYYILKDAIDMHGFFFVIHIFLAILFYVAVRIFGSKYFNYH